MGVVITRAFSKNGQARDYSKSGACSALEFAPKKAAGTSAGFTGLFGYLGGTVAAACWRWC
ncbi:hypothetical protein [Conchiformibius kuhniae]|uniref:Uncharacterized protein n=1 Tax=Conchiformibius kuhniae TaxID=211502 RepID=A0A8T9MUU3_9NEIS|nr:hypothetical protein [Conchiformibius kuhniae]UOP04971.1 hypothetical protein LVJ77_01105 [Conchiformibius kuhniae]